MTSRNFACFEGCGNNASSDVLCKYAEAYDKALEALKVVLEKRNMGEYEDTGLILGKFNNRVWESLLDRNKSIPVGRPTYINNELLFDKDSLKHIVDRRIINNRYKEDRIVAAFRNLLNNRKAEYRLSEHHYPTLRDVVIAPYHKPGNSIEWCNFMNIEPDRATGNPRVHTYYDTIMSDVYKKLKRRT